MEKARSTLKQFVRDWSQEVDRSHAKTEVKGAVERELTYTPILKTLDQFYGHLSVEEK